MIGLVLKDLYTLRKQMHIFILMAVLYLAIGLVAGDSNLLNIFVTIACVFLPISAMAYDEKSNWDPYALTMPVNRGQMVFSKYLLSLIAGVAAFWILLLYNVMVLRGAKFDEMVLQPLIMLMSGIVMAAILLPLIFKFGVERGRIIMLIVFIVPFFIGMMLPRLNINIDLSNVENQFILYPIITVVVVLLSMWISIRIYKKKEFA